MNNKYATKNASLDIRQVFWQQKKLIFIVTALTIIITGLFIYQYEPTYEASVTIGTPLEPQASLIRTSVFSYLRPFQEQAFSTAESHNTFARFLLDPSTRNFFLISNSIHSLIMVYPRYDYKKTRYLIKVKAKTSKEAQEHLNEYLFFLLRESAQYWTMILENRQQVAINQLHSVIAQLKQNKGVALEHPHSFLEKTHTINIPTAQEVNFFAPQLTPQLMKTIQEKNLLDKEHLLFLPEIKKTLFYFESPISVSDTLIKSKLLSTLIIGGLGGLLLGFLLAALYCGNVNIQLNNELL